MELDLVDAVAEPIMSAQLGRVTVRGPSPLGSLRGTREVAKSIQLFGSLGSKPAVIRTASVVNRFTSAKGGGTFSTSCVGMGSVCRPGRSALCPTEQSDGMRRSAAVDRQETDRVADTSQGPRGVGRGPSGQWVEESSVSR